MAHHPPAGKQLAELHQRNLACSDRARSSVIRQTFAPRQAPRQPTKRAPLVGSARSVRAHPALERGRAASRARDPPWCAEDAPRPGYGDAELHLRGAPAEAAIEVPADGELRATEDVRVEVVVVADVEHSRPPRLVTRVHQVPRAVRDVAVARVVGRARRDVPHRVHQLVQHCEVHDLQPGARALRLVAGRSRPVRRPQVERRHHAGKPRGPGAAPARRGAGAVVVRGVHLAGPDDALRAELVLERVPQEHAVGGELRIRPGEPHEGDVELATGRVEPEPVVEGLPAQPALPVRERGGDRPVRVEPAVRAVGGEDVQRVNLRPRDLVAAVGRGPRERVGCRARGRRRREQREGDARRDAPSGSGHSHSIVAGGFEETS